MRTLIQGLLPRGELSRDTLTLVLGSGVGRGLVLLAAPLLTRIYAPADFGLFAVYVSLATIPVAVASLRFEAAIPLPKAESDGRALVLLASTIALASAMLIAVLIWAQAETIASWSGQPALAGFLWWLPVSLLSLAWFQVLNLWAVRTRAFREIAIAQAVQALALVTVQIVLGLTQIYRAGLIIGHALGAVLGVATFLWLRRVRSSLFAATPDRSAIVAMASRYRRFPLIASWSGVLNAAGLRLPALFFAAYYGVEVAGYFALGQMVVSVPMLLIGNAVGQAYFGAAARSIREAPHELEPLFLKVVRTLFLMVLPVVLVLGFAAPGVFAIVFGADWREAGDYVQLLVPVLLMQFVVSPLSHTVFVLERQGLQVVWDLFRVTVIVAIFVIGDRLGLDAGDTVAVYGWSMGGLYLVLLAAYWKAIHARSSRL